MQILDIIDYLIILFDDRYVNISVTVSSFKFVCVRVSSGVYSCILLTIYRPGSAPVYSLFFDELTEMLDHVATLHEPLFVADDLNVRLDRPDNPYCRRVNDVLASRGHSRRRVPRR